MEAASHQTVQRLVRLMSLEDRARRCRSRSEAQACIRRAEATKQKLWGHSDHAIETHF